MKKVSKSQFTLIELLVVIAIIAILAAILLPALNSACERGIQTDCMSRQKSVGSAINMYRGDYNDMFVSQNGKVSTDSQRNWIVNLMKCKYISIGEKHDDAISYICPSEQAASGINISRGYGIFTYMNYNSAWNYYAYAISLKMQCIQKVGESKIIFVADSSQCTTSAAVPTRTSTNLMAAGSATKDYGLPYARHNNTLNGLLLDGHVESVTGEQMYDKFRWNSIMWSGTPLPTASSKKTPVYVNQKVQAVSLGSSQEEFKHTI